MSPLQHLASRAASALSQLAVREDKNCINEEGGDMCALPNAGTHTTPIVIGTIGGVLAIAIVAVLIHLHLRRQRMDAKEWTGKNVQELDDYGLSNGSSGPTKPKSTYQADVAHAKSEQPAAKSSIPSGARRSSQDSLRSLEMSLRQQHKPADMV